MKNADWRCMDGSVPKKCGLVYESNRKPFILSFEKNLLGTCDITIGDSSFDECSGWLCSRSGFNCNGITCPDGSKWNVQTFQCELETEVEQCNPGTRLCGSKCVASNVPCQNVCLDSSDWLCPDTGYCIPQTQTCGPNFKCADRFAYCHGFKKCQPSYKPCFGLCPSKTHSILCRSTGRCVSSNNECLGIRTSTTTTSTTTTSTSTSTSTSIKTAERKPKAGKLGDAINFESDQDCNEYPCKKSVCVEGEQCQTICIGLNETCYGVCHHSRFLCGETCILKEDLLAEADEQHFQCPNTEDSGDNALLTYIGLGIGMGSFVAFLFLAFTIHRRRKRKNKQRGRLNSGEIMRENHSLSAGNNRYRSGSAGSSHGEFLVEIIHKNEYYESSKASDVVQQAQPANLSTFGTGEFEIVSLDD